MNYRCKFCGYRFKDKDEQVCPECLTAREEDISCGVYGEDEHSHSVFDERSYTNSFVNNDTFRDGKADFLREEKREEKRNDTARYERRNGGDINMEADSAGRFVRPAPNYNNIQRPTQPSYNRANQYQQPKKGNKGCGCILTIFVIIIMILMAVPDSIDKITEFIDKIENENSTSVSKEKGSTKGEILQKVGDCDVDIYCTKYDKTLSKTDDDGFDMFSKKALSFIENDEETDATKSEVRDIYQVLFDLKVRHSDGKRVETEEFDIESVDCFAYDADDNMLSSYKGYLNDITMYTIGDNSTMNPKMYYAAEADHISLTITANYKGSLIVYYYDL